MPALPLNPSDQATVQSFATVFARLKPHMAVLDVFLRGQLAAFEPEIHEVRPHPGQIHVAKRMRKLLMTDGKSRVLIRE